MWSGLGGWGGKGLPGRVEEAGGRLRRPIVRRREESERRGSWSLM